MKKALLILSIASSCAMATGNHDPKPDPQNQNQGQLQGQAQGQSQESSAKAYGGDSKSTSGAAAVSGSDSSAKSVSDSQSGAESNSGASNAVSVSQEYHNRYPDIPVNAGFTFASLCQTGSSATNAKVSLAITTDDQFCQWLRLADVHRMVRDEYATACKADLDSQVAAERHAKIVAASAKGVMPTEPVVWKISDDCLDADDSQKDMVYALKQAKDIADRTHGTGIFAKIAAQIGIPVSLLAVLLMVL